MNLQFYRLRRGRFISGVLSGISDKFHWDVRLVRFLVIVFALFTRAIPVILIYALLSYLLPVKEDVEQDLYGTGPRKRKDADIIDDSTNRWFW